MNNIPKICKKAICISTDTSYTLAQSVSRYFSKKGEYFAVFNLLDLAENKKENLEFNDDGYIGQVLGRHSSVYINNAIVRIEPEFILFVGLTEIQKSYLAGLDRKKIIHIDSAKDITKYHDLFSKYTDNNEPVDKEFVVVLEDEQDIDTVLAENIAIAMGARIVYVEKTETYILNKITKYIDDWKENDKYSSYTKLENLVKSRVGGIDFSKYKNATFFTNGIPYGLVLGNPIPFCYVNKKLRPDIFIINNILYSQESFGTAISFSIDEFLNAEPKEVNNILLRNKFLPVNLFRSRATTFNFDHYASHLPYDILHISSHGGIKTKAYHVLQKFNDREGNQHTVEYYEVPSFMGLPLEDSEKNIAVYTKSIFLKFDNYRWMSKELKDQNIPQFIFEDMRKAITFEHKSKRNTKRELVTDPVIDSSTLTCNDGPHQGQFHEIAAGNGPVIFNNSCWSWSEISTFFIACGARGYIGTLWPIENSVATKGAIKFYECVLDKEMAIPNAVWDLNKNISNLVGGQKDIFFVWSLPFSKMNKVTDGDEVRFIREVMDKLSRWIEKAITSKEEDVKKNSERIIQFILWVINKEFGANLIDMHKKEILETFGYDLEKNLSVLNRSSPF